MDAIYDSPAYHAGVPKNGYLLTVNSAVLKAIKLDKVMKLLQGEQRSNITLSVLDANNLIKKF